MQQKLILGVIFGMGTFVIVAAILRAIYCIVPALVSYVYMNWYFREASVAIYVTTLPGIWVFLREIFPVLSRLGTSRKGTKPTSQSGTNNWHQQPPKSSRNRNLDLTKHDDMDLDTWPIASKITVTTAEQELEQGRSQNEDLHGDASSTSSTRYDGAAHEIRRDMSFTVETIPMEKH